MGRRAKKAPVQTKKRATLAKRFKCPFCANDEVVECKMDMKAGVGSLACRLCGASYQMPIHHLHEPIDVFSEWLDDCEAAQNPQAQQQQQQSSDSLQQQRHYESDDDDDDLGEDSGLGRKREEEQKKPSSKQQQPSYSSLGLDDSDEDSE